MTAGEALVADLFEEAARVGGYRRQKVVVRRRKSREEKKEGEGGEGGGREGEGENKKDGKKEEKEDEYEPLGEDEVEYPTLHEEAEFDNFENALTDAEREQLDALDQETLGSLVAMLQRQVDEIKKFFPANP